MWTLTLTTPQHVAECRRAVEAVYRKGGLTREQRAIALGNLAEAEAKLRLAAPRN